MIEFGNPVQYGVIKRIETAVDTSEEIAEVETVSYNNTTRRYLHSYIHIICYMFNRCTLIVWTSLFLGKQSVEKDSTC